MFKGIKTLATAALLTGLAVPASASLVTFNDGVNAPVSFDEMGVTTNGDSVITQTYVDGVNDTFVELGLTAATVFKTNGAPSGILNGFDLIFDANLVGTAATIDNGDGTYNVNVTFGSLSAADFYYDDVQFGGLNGTTTKIAELSLGQGSCELVIDTTDITANNEGKCNISFNFDSLIAGWFQTSWGEDFTTYVGPTTIDFALDIDVTKYMPGFPETTINVAHDGSAVINVPEPTTIAILGLGLLGLAGTRRRS